MDCLEFRRVLGSEPRVVDSAAREHLRSCSFCADATSRAQAFEARLAKSVAVPIPDGLADRILLAQLTGARAQRRSGVRRFGWIALAAAASIALAIGMVRYQSAPDVLANLVIAHIDGAEKAALQLRAPIPATAIERAFADRGVRLASVPADVSYVHECPIGNWRSVHMVMPEQGAAVSVLYVVNHPRRSSNDFRRDGMHGREVPIANGTLVLVAQSAAHFDSIEHIWRDAIEGPAQVAAGSR
ncbi:MAG: DUF3379 family protein [Dokdonella sp.]